MLTTSTSYILALVWTRYGVMEAMVNQAMTHGCHVPGSAEALNAGAAPMWSGASPTQAPTRDHASYTISEGRGQRAEGLTLVVSGDRVVWLAGGVPKRKQKTKSGVSGAGT